MVANAARLDGAARHITPSGLLAITWSLFVLAACFVALRFYARLKELRKLLPDDYWLLTALAFLLINAVLQTLQTSSLYYLVYAGAGLKPAGQELVELGTAYVRYEFVIIALFWTVTWCVKASFLALYWRLFQDLDEYRKGWWAVAVFTALGYCGCWVGTVCTCHPPSAYFQFGQCDKPADVRGGTISISYSTAIDILTDILIMLLPLRLIRDLQVNTRQKAGLVGVFCVGIIVIVTASVRATQILGKDRTDPVGLAVWGIIESSVSVVVGSLPALKRFLSSALERTREISSGGRSWSGRRRTPSRYWEDPSGITDTSFSKRSARAEAIALQDREGPDGRVSEERLTRSLNGEVFVGDGPYT